MATISNTFNHGVTWEGVYGYSQAHQVGNTVYISGQLAHDDQGLVGDNDIDKQLEVSFAPTSTTFGATELALPGQLVEVGAVVLLDLPR